jgi:hypothetical protein
LRRYAGREPQEAVGSGLAELMRMDDTGRHLCVETVDEPELGRAHTTFAALAELVTAHEVVEEEHEVVEEEFVHPLTRRLNPDDRVADRLLEEERVDQPALTDTIRADRTGAWPK